MKPVVEERDFEPKAPFHHNDAGPGTSSPVEIYLVVRSHGALGIHIPVFFNEKLRSYEEFPNHMIESGWGIHTGGITAAFFHG